MRATADMTETPTGEAENQRQMAEEDAAAAADALSASDLHFVFACGLSASDLATCALVSKFWR